MEGDATAIPLEQIEQVDPDDNGHIEDPLGTSERSNSQHASEPSTHTGSSGHAYSILNVFSSNRIGATMGILAFIVALIALIVAWYTYRITVLTACVTANDVRTSPTLLKQWTG